MRLSSATLCIQSPIACSLYCSISYFFMSFSESFAGAYNNPNPSTLCVHALFMTAIFLRAYCLSRTHSNPLLLWNSSGNTRLRHSTAHGRKDTFQNLGLPRHAVTKLQRPTVAQRKFIPAILEGKDILLSGTTGTGKTFVESVSHQEGWPDGYLCSRSYASSRPRVTMRVLDLQAERNRHRSCGFLLTTGPATPSQCNRAFDRSRTPH
ncbi:hypothetical protein BXZ70DRAFT_787331 [Cristinia sonorae]|uniref:Uncharacterized protein n=1 Tax=Cristinia sonorae TaxID=1940300 RepID=A0A8K0USU1_9AGAR|nr:hypothetical protein BXZ70DRAFT_787331 [Cristinia sonorae]